MIVQELGEVLTVELWADDCERLAHACRTYAGHENGSEASHFDDLSGFFTAAALVCKVHGSVNLSEEVQAELASLVRRVRRDGEETEAE